MINVSSEFSEALYGDDRRDYIERAKITLKDNTVLNLTEENIWSGGFTIDDAVSADKIFQVGSAIVNKATLVINNIYEDYSEYDFTDAIIELSVGLELESKTEVFKKGTYIEQETKYNGSLITIEMYDYMSKFDVGYTTELPYPLRLIDILQDSCNTCGVVLATTEFPNSSTPINTKPTNATHREIISWIACMAGCYARCNADGELELKWFDVGTVEEATADGGTFNPWNTGDVLDGGTFNPWTTGDIIDAGRFSEYNVNHTITQRYSGEIAVDDVVITCVKVTVKTETGSGGESIVEHIVGTEGYAVKVENNGFITEENAQFITNFLGNKLIGLRFRIAEISHPSDPSIEAGDIAYYFDRKGNRYVLLITRTVFTVGEPQTTSCDAETPARNSAERYSERTKNYVELRKIAESNVSYLDDAKAYTDEQLNVYKGVVNAITGDLQDQIDQIDGQFETFYYDYEPTLQNEPAYTWVQNSEEAKHEGDIFYWKSKGYSYRFMQDNGVWSWVQIQDTDVSRAIGLAQEAQATADGKRRVFVSQPTPPYDIGDLWAQGANGDILRCKTAKAEGASYDSADWERASKYTDDSALTTFINGQYSTTLQDVRGQIDSKAEIWYQESDPSTPWSATDKPNHKGDLWYKTTDGTTWVYDGSAWVEQTIPESIFDEIDGKAQIFVGSTTPVDPKSGDLWFRSANDPILTYVNGNWIEYNNYANASGIEELLMEEVGKIQIGGTNLLRNTQDYFYTGLLDLEGCLYSQNCVLRGHYRECAIAEYDNTEQSALGDMLAWHNVMVDLSTTYTLSFWAKADTITDPTLYAYFYGEIGYPEVAKGVSSEGTTNTNTDGLMPFTLTSDWKRYWVKWTIADQGDVEIGKWVLFRAAALSNVSVAGVKLEKGSIATYYSPSPTDVDDTISRLRESSKYGTCETSADVQEKYVELVNFNLDVGTQFAVTFINGNESERVMLNVNGTGTKFVTIDNDIDLGRKMIFPSGTTASFVYDGSTYRFVASDNLYNLINWSAEAGLDIRAEEGSLSRVNINNQSVDVYDSDGNLGTSTSSDGFDVYKNGTLIASFGERTVLGEKDVGTRIELSKSAIEFFEKTIRTAYLAEDKFYFINGEVTQSLFFPDYSVREDTNQDLVMAKR